MKNGTVEYLKLYIEISRSKNVDFLELILIRHKMVVDEVMKTKHSKFLKKLTCNMLDTLKRKAENCIESLKEKKR